MTKTFKLSTIDQAVQVGATLSRSWFRGHSRVHNELVPRLFRKEFTGLRPRLEDSMIDAFMRGAPALEEGLPSRDEHVE